jgi:hypothetical protein
LTFFELLKFDESPASNITAPATPRISADYAQQSTTGDQTGTSDAKFIRFKMETTIKIVCHEFCKQKQDGSSTTAKRDGTH